MIAASRPPANKSVSRDAVIKGGPRDARCKFRYIGLSNFTTALRGFLSQHGFLCLQTAIELSVRVTSTRKNQSDRIFNADMTPPLFHLNFSDVPVGPDHP